MTHVAAVTPEALFEANHARLSELALRALSRGHAARDFLVVCIEVDSTWRTIVDDLMPRHDWQAVRDRGEKPIARGTVMREGLADLLSARVPDIAGALRSTPAPGTAHAVVLGSRDGHGCASVYTLQPQPEPS